MIEMLVVVAVISILSGLTLTGIGGFTSRARDTRRIGDLRSVQNYLEAYYTKCGKYPGAADCGGTSVTGDWSSLQAILTTSVGVNAPADPVAGRTYFYGVNTTLSNQKYIVGVKLENDNKALDDAGELDSTAGFVLTSGAAVGDCDDAANGYCVGS